jgi:hypothetical protein
MMEMLDQCAGGLVALSPDKDVHRAARVVKAALVFVFASSLSAQPRIDNVLERMVPPGATSLVGGHMDQIKQTEIYKKLLATQNLSQLDEFARDTGFDPRRDVRELLYTTGPQGSVMLARGTFHLSSTTLKAMKKTRHGQYDIWGLDGNGFCILDSTLAAAGDIPAVEAALDEWTSGSHTAAQPLLTRVAGINTQSQLWGISIGLGNFLADHPPAANSGLDFSKIFSSLHDYWFQADFSAGMRAEVHGTAGTEKDAVSLRDTVRGLVGLGRLNVPENQSELLKVWDGITVDQQGRSLSLHADIPQDLIDKMVLMLNAVPAGPRQIL